jgi:hypothetical protein
LKEGGLDMEKAIANQTDQLQSGPTAGRQPPRETSIADRRATRRAKTDVFVNRFLNGHPYLCRMTDISLSGARLVVINEPRITPAPTYMGLQFQLPGRREVITASGETVTGGSGSGAGSSGSMGVRFTRLPAGAAAAIEALLAPA